MLNKLNIAILFFMYVFPSEMLTLFSTTRIYIGFLVTKFM